MMAAVAIGAYANMDDCIAEWVTPLLGEAEAPDAEQAHRYDRLFTQPIWTYGRQSHPHGTCLPSNHENKQAMHVGRTDDF